MPPAKRTFCLSQKNYSDPVDYIFHPDFKKPKKVKEIMRPMPDKKAFDEERNRIRAISMKNVEPDLYAVYQEPLLNREQEIHLFKKYNFLKYKASLIQKKAISDYAIRDKFRRLVHRAEAVRHQIAVSNFRLVPKIVGKLKNKYRSKEEMLNEGYLRVWLTIPKFNVNLGWRFSTYATYALYNNLAQAHNKEQKYHIRFKAGLEIEKNSTDDFVGEIAKKEELKIISDAALGVLAEMEKDFIDKKRAYAVKQYFGLLKGMPKVLRNIGEDLDITKERVRQLKNEGLEMIKQELIKQGIGINN